MSSIRKCLSCARKGYNVGETSKDICPLCYSPTLKHDDFIESMSGKVLEKVPLESPVELSKSDVEFVIELLERNLLEIPANNGNPWCQRSAGKSRLLLQKLKEK